MKIFILSYLFLFLSCALDLIIAAIFEEPILCIPLILYILAWFKPNQFPWHYRITAALLVACENFVEYDRFALPFVYIIPLSFAIIYLKKTVHGRWFIPMLLLGISLAIHYWIIPLLLGLTLPAGGYTVCKIIANILVMIILA